jgi:ClpX C4-type zinc finger protein
MATEDAITIEGNMTSGYTRGQQADRDTRIKRGQEAWRRHKVDATWLDWLAIGEALSIGRQEAMADADTNRPIGSRYNAAFGEWLTHHRFDDIDKGDRSRLFDVMDNLPAIEGWRATLTQTARLRLNHPNSVLRKWKAATVVKPPKEPKPTLRDSVANLSEENAAKDQRIAELEARVQEAEAARDVTPRFDPVEGDDAVQCAFCDKFARDVEHMVQGNRAAICNECIALCVDTVRESEERKKKRSKKAKAK